MKMIAYSNLIDNRPELELLFALSALARYTTAFINLKETLRVVIFHVLIFRDVAKYKACAN